jgi:hypothetical protein
MAPVLPGPIVAVPPPGPSTAAAPAGSGFGAVLRATAAPAGPAPARVGPGSTAAASSPGQGASAARQALASIERAQRRLDSVLDAARRGRTFTAQELLVLQAETYRCTQMLDVASRAVEHAAQSVKQAVNTQV